MASEGDEACGAAVPAGWPAIPGSLLAEAVEFFDMDRLDYVKCSSSGQSRLAVAVGTAKLQVQGTSGGLSSRAA